MEPSKSKDKKKLDKVPICLDLDGTIIFSDTLYESFIKLIFLKPYYLFIFPF